MNKRKLELGMALLLLVGTYFLARAGASMVAKQEEAVYTVVVDPGHGGSDPGKIGIHNEQEKDINLQISELLKAELEANQVRVVMTRTEDMDLAGENSQNRKLDDLRARCELIHETNPDCVISVHQNSYSEEAINGAQVFYYEHSAEGKKLAEILQDALVTGLDPENHRQAKGNTSYYMLKKTDATLVIVECGFLSNGAEAAKLSDESYQKQVAEAICQGTLTYLEQTGEGLT